MCGSGIRICYAHMHVECRSLPFLGSRAKQPVSPRGRKVGRQALHIIAPILLLLPFLPSAYRIDALARSLARSALIFVNFRAPPFPSCFLVVEFFRPVLQNRIRCIRCLCLVLAEQTVVGYVQSVKSNMDIRT